MPCSRQALSQYCTYCGIQSAAPVPGHPVRVCTSSSLGSGWHMHCAVAATCPTHHVPVLSAPAHVHANHFRMAGQAVWTNSVPTTVGWRNAY